MTEDEMSIINSLLKDYHVYYCSIKENNRSLYDFKLWKDYKESLKHIQKHAEQLNPCHYDYYCEKEGGHVICRLKDKVEMLLGEITRKEYLERKKAEEVKEIKCDEEHGKIIFSNAEEAIEEIKRVHGDSTIIKPEIKINDEGKPSNLEGANLLDQLIKESSVDKCSDNERAFIFPKAIVTK